MENKQYQEQATELTAKLWAIANDLRGNMDSSKFKNYILGVIFYKYLSERTEMYMEDILKNDGLSYEEAFESEDFRPIVEQWSLEHLGYVITPNNLYRKLVKKIEKPENDEDNRLFS